ncbi:MAG: LuxR C-terminal-related transcriptional regulator [Polyangiaceae bacterium]
MSAFAASLRRPGAILDAIYDLRTPRALWLRRLVQRMRADLDGGLGAYALLVDIDEQPGRFLIPPVLVGVPDDVRDEALPVGRSVPLPVAAHLRAHLVEFASVSQLFGPEMLNARQSFRDSVALTVQDGEGTSLQIVALQPALVRVHGRSRSAWRRLGLHVGIAWRLRRRLERGATPEAILGLDGKVVEARGVARSRSARESLAHAVQRIESVRAGNDRASPEQVLDLWRGLVSGRWSLVDRWERDGRRYVAAYENVAAPDVRGLVPWELSVLRCYQRNATAEETAFATGLELATVDRVLGSAARRLGLRRPAELVRLTESGLLDRIAVQVGDDQLHVLRFDPPTLPADWRSRLSPAQAAVVTAAAQGLADSEIARDRRVSVRTVSNQLAAVYRELGLGGRAELIRRVGRASMLPRH